MGNQSSHRISRSRSTWSIEAVLGGSETIAQHDKWQDMRTVQDDAQIFLLSLLLQSVCPIRESELSEYIGCLVLSIRLEELILAQVT